MISGFAFPLLVLLSVFQSEDSIQLDGQLGEDEWRNSQEYLLKEDCKVLLLVEGNFLYAAVVSKNKIWAHAYLSDGETVQVMHASAALDAVQYKKQKSVWKTEETFQWEFRDRVFNSEVKSKMDSYFQTHGWVANNNTMGDGKTIEFKIDISKKAPLYFACVLADFDVKLSSFPKTLTDDTVLPNLVQGYTPDSLKFNPTSWFNIK